MAAGNSSGKRASSSSSKKQQAKRRRGAFVPGAASNVLAVPMVGISCVAPDGRSAAAPGAATALALAVVSGDGAAPLLLVPVPVQAVAVQMQLVCFVAMPVTAVSGSGSPSPAGGVSLAVTLCRFQNATLARMMEELAMECTPPLLVRQDRTNSGTPPPWWPTAVEPWWGPEVAAHLRGRPMDIPVPFAALHRLKKAEMVAVLVAMVKHIAPDFGRIAGAASRSRLTELETSLWERALRSERQRHVMPAFVLPPPSRHPTEIAAGTNCDGRSEQIVTSEPEQQQKPHGNGNDILLPRHSAMSVAHDNSDPDSEEEHPVDFPVSGEDAAHDGGTEKTVAAEPEQQPLHGNGNGNIQPMSHSVESGGAHADTDSDNDDGTAAPAAEGEGQQPEGTSVPLLEQHGGESHDHHQDGDFSGELTSPAVPEELAPENVDWFDCDEVRRRMADLEIPSFFGGYYI